MNDESVFGPVVHELGFAEAIERGLLADYYVVVATTTDTELARLIADDAVLATDAGRLPARMFAASMAVLRLAAARDLQRVLTCHNHVDHARRFVGTLDQVAALLPAAEWPDRSLSAHLLTGAMSWPQRERVLARLAEPGEKTSIVANVKVLSEGVDIPELDAVVFCDPRTSPVDVTQATGRALRRGKRQDKTATIIIPVVLPEDADITAALESGAFDVVWSVVRGLRHHDERLATWIEEARRTGAHTRTQGVPAWLTVAGTAITPETAAAIGIAVIDRASAFSPCSAPHSPNGRPPCTTPPSTARPTVT